ncbi:MULTISPECIES: MerR family transcriptional regulator [unclassified Microbacterium]|uniref:MerR family transcriptional regulator n=1 Tax=unclassified Microbacterium TaxID=2609290 RepID=UPI00214AC291|nr:MULTISPECIES: MerR family transcriptional regulator [unclassified Microbacterium]MCR2809095.1 MerR family transcriptional regulator [Microbacterium sp. zg.B185]WIM20250.1 MerR family transcriptional regulator [Microbacterium sp. zg-B185]
MPWSTRELAEMASTTVNTIRHYHRIGLLEEPERRYNGYKQYGVRHLVSLLRIRRLAELGVPLSQMPDLSVGVDGAPDALRALDAELQMSIARLQSARADIAEILHHGAPADGPAGFESVASRLSERDRSVIHIYSQFYDEGALADVRRMAADTTDDTSAEIDRLPADADERARQDLAERLAKSLAQNIIDYPWLSDPSAHLSRKGKVNARTFVDAMAELYNPAQLDVMLRAHAIADERVRAMRNPSGPVGP